MKRLITAVAALLVVGVLTSPALAAKGGHGGNGGNAGHSGGGGGGGASIQPASWWSPPATLSSTSTSNTGAVSWKDCVSTGEPTGAPPGVGNCITFDFQTNYWDTSGGTGPWLQLQCYDPTAGYLILSDSRAGFPGGYGYGVPFVLNGTAWLTGPANCTAVVGHSSNTSGKFMVDASTDFYVSG